MKRFQQSVRTLLAGAVVSGTCSLPALAQSPAEFYKGKTVSMLVGSAPGGGYATYAGVLARHYGQHIPGTPSVVAKSMPGAGSLKATSIIYNKSPRDGTELAAIFMAAPMEPLIGEQGKDFDATKLIYVGSLNTETSICIGWHTAGFTKFEDVLAKEMIVGASGWTSSIRQYPTVLKNVLGAKFRVISGYDGSAEARLAMEKGETHGICGIQWSSFATSHLDWVRDKKVHILVQLAPDPLPELEKLGVPIIWKFVKTPEQERALRVIFSQLKFGRPYILPPGVPADRVKAMRDAFMAAAKDPALLAEAEKAKIGIDAVSGEDVQKLVTEVYKTPPADVERAKKALGTESEAETVKKK